MSRAHRLCAFSYCLLGFVALSGDLQVLATLALRDDRFTHILFIPIISALLILRNRATVFSRPAASLLPAFAAIASALLSYIAANVAGDAFRLSFAGLSAILFVLAGFLLLIRVESAAFPILVLFLAVPLPIPVVEVAVNVLQSASASLAAILFRILGIPVHHRDFALMLPGLTLEIAPECSGIRSTIAMLILSAVTGHIFLRKNVNRALLVLAAVPIAILKNALRIVLISVLGIYVSPAFLHGSLHRYSGLVLSPVGFFLVFVLLLFLRHVEWTIRLRGVGKPLFPSGTARSHAEVV